jgi:general secretion pathway protein L
VTTLYIRHPAKASIDAATPGAPPGAAPLCRFALVGDGGALLQQGATALGSLTDLIGASRRVVLLLAASDVTLLRVKIPPLSSARLKLALPGLVEEQILGDPFDCVLVAAPASASASTAGADGMRTVAVVQRAWLEVLVKALLAQGARSIRAVPAQLCLPQEPGCVAASISTDEAGLELTLRQSQHEGFGMALGPGPAPALQMLRALAHDAPVTLYVPADELARYQAVLGELGLGGITLLADDWVHWVSASKSATPDLIPALGASASQGRDWRRWRWPLRLALLALVVNLAGINLEWMQLKRDAAAVRLTMLQTFKAVYPKETVILDPEAQMRKNISIARLASGQLASDEFTTISAAFGEAMASSSGSPVVATLEYRERALLAKFKPADAAALAQRKEQVTAALAARQLQLLEIAPGTWQIRSAALGASS